jgi:hypothetical protein
MEHYLKKKGVGQFEFFPYEFHQACAPTLTPADKAFGVGTKLRRKR